MNDLASAGRRRFALAHALWLFGLVAYFIPGTTWNPTSRYALTRAIVEEHRLSIDPYAMSTGDRALLGDHYYSDKAPVVALLAVPVYALVRALDTAGAPSFEVLRHTRTGQRRVVTNPAFRRGLYACSLATAGLAFIAVALLSFQLLVRAGASAPLAFSVSSAVALGTPLFAYGTNFYGHVVAAAFLLLAVSALGRASDGDGDRTARWRRVAGASFALAVGSEYILFFPVLVAAAVALISAPRQARLGWVRDCVLGAAAPVAVVSAYHTACFGAPWRTAYSFIQAENFAAGHAQGLLGVSVPDPAALAGLLVGEERGLFWLSPVAAVAVLGLPAVWRRLPMMRGALLASATLLLVNAGYYMWWGGAAAGPRHLVPALPFLALGLHAALRDWPRLRGVAIMLTGVSVLNVFVVTAVGIEAPETGDVLSEYAYPRLLAGRLASVSEASNVGIALGLGRGATLGPVLAWCWLGFFYLLWRAREASLPRPA